MITEVELLPPPFIQRSANVKRIPIDDKSYVVSQRGVEILIYRQQRKLKRAKDLADKVLIQGTIKKLKAIEKDLQKALEL